MNTDDQPLDTPLLVLAGGFGTRLRTVVSEVPKPLAPVMQQPFLHYLLQHWIGQGIRRFIFLLHHQAATIAAYLEQEARSGILKDSDIATVVEEQPLGTGGAVAHAVRKSELQGGFLVANADTWLGSGVRSLCSVAPPALAMVNVGNTERYGSVIAQNGTILAFKEKQMSAGAGMINAGLYHLEADLFRDWKGDGFSLEQGLFPRLVREQRLHAVALKTDFIDIGVPEDYYRFCRWIESGKKDPL